MTKDEARILMKTGKAIRHSYFADDEFMFERNGRYHFEDKVSCTPREFWAERIGSEWETGWDIHIEMV